MNGLKLSDEYSAMQKRGRIPEDIPSFVLDNINRKFELRDYQKDAITRFIEYCENEPDKKLPIQILFNMATGSGKTLIMATLMLYLYEKGYKNIVFFVDKTNIIKKTIDNFLNPDASKHLFANRIFVDGQEVLVKKVENFSQSSDNSINIHFSTISGLHSRMNNPKENSITYEDFEKEKTIFISDEAHHINALTKNKLSKAEQEEKTSWEYTVNKLVNSHIDNILLEFTATIDWDNPSVYEKYKSRVLMEYDLRDFREDKFSKDVFLFQSDASLEDRMLQAVIVSQFRRKVAEKHRITLKPVVLMKSKTIKESQENLLKFIDLIKNLKVADVERCAKLANQAEEKNNVLKKAFDFFEENKIKKSDLIKELKVEFSENRMIEVNSNEESEEKQILINTLEDETNEIRVVFAVDKLNEGWDVLNLFDIVRLYGTRDSGKPTIQEAQLIGRGARYYPFVLKNESEKYKRKFDDELENELRALEELHFYSIQNHRYISELRKELVKSGIHREVGTEVSLKVKDAFKRSRFYKKGVLYKNERVINKREDVKSLGEVVNIERPEKINIESGSSINVVSGFGKDEIKSKRTEITKTIYISKLPKHIVRKSLDRVSFFNFENLKKYFPNIQSIDEFIDSEDYLGGMQVEISSVSEGYKASDLFRRLIPVIENLKNSIKANSAEFKGTKEFTSVKASDVIKEKTIIVEKPKDNSIQERGLSMSGENTGINLDLFSEDWYVYNDDYGTSEEKYLVKFIYTIIDKLKTEFKEVHLIRNQKLIEIYSFKQGLRFEPDYLLILGDNKDNASYIQLFIEPKGSHIEDADRWKEDFLNEIKQEKEIVNLLENDKYSIYGLPFYQEQKKNVFKQRLEEILKIKM